LVMAYSFCFAPLLAARPTGATATRCRKDPEMERSSKSWTGVAGSNVKANLGKNSSSPMTLGGYRPRGCQAIEIYLPFSGLRAVPRRNEGGGETLPQPSVLTIRFVCQRRSGAGVLDGAVGAVRIDVERARRAFHDLAGDHDLFHAFQARQIEHGLQQDGLED